MYSHVLAFKTSKNQLTLWQILAKSLLNNKTNNFNEILHSEFDTWLIFGLSQVFY